MSQTDPHTTEIDGHTYTMYMWDPFLAQEWSIYLSQIFGPSLGDIAGALAGAETGAGGLFAAKLEPNKVSDSIGGIFHRLDAKKLKELTVALGAQCNLHLEGGDAIPLDAKQLSNHFKGRLGAMFHWMKWGLGVQLADFIEALVPSLEGLMERLTALAPGQTDSQKPSGAKASSGDS